jgi:hypothetical protein
MSSTGIYFWRLPICLSSDLVRTVHQDWKKQYLPIHKPHFMKSFLILNLIFLFTGQLLAQDSLQHKIDSITREGKLLYQSEMASWYGTDIFLERYKNRENIGGYLSYMDGDVPTCIFFSRGDNPGVIGTIRFDSTYSVKSARVDLAARDFSASEKNLFGFRKAALNVVNSGDTLFKFYDNSSYNLIPVTSNGERKVYILSGPNQNGVVLFGNDYLLKFDDQDKLLSKRRLHKNMIAIEYGKNKRDTAEVVTVHSHLPETGDLMTATDVGTLLLYSRIAGWQQHLVVSEKYINIWDSDKGTFIAITQEAARKILGNSNPENH